MTDAYLRRKAGELAKDPKYAGMTQDEIYYAIRSVYRNDQVGTGDLKTFDSEAAAKSAGVPASYDPTTGKWLEDPEVATARLDGTQRTQFDSNLRNDLWSTGGAFKDELIEASKPSVAAGADALVGAAISGWREKAGGTLWPSTLPSEPMSTQIATRSTCL
ncbi:hypothetical protein [Cupriavidus sp. D384]|uniref:hypothetical protein n=1 Tax=Cupriavidus sp. D384 TaxID=1538095 RepID=UPI000A86CD3A|nr:hypothetical protein [Cupriavidus sp. D384]